MYVIHIYVLKYKYMKEFLSFFLEFIACL